MLDDALQALATTAGNAVVSAMATDVWEQARTRTAQAVRLLHRKQRKEIGVALDRDAAVLGSARDQDRTRQELQRLWQARLTELLTEDARFGLELRALVAEIGALLPSGPGGHVQYNRARAGGIIYAVQNGTQIVHDSHDGFGR